MKPVYRIIIFILICWFGYNAFRKTLSAQDAGFLGSLQHFDVVLLVILSLIAIASDISAYRSYPKLFQFYSSIVALFLCAIVFLQLIRFSNIERSETLFKMRTKVGSQPDLFIQFKENNYLRMEELNGYTRDVYYGKYYRSKDTIIVTQTNYNKVSDSLPSKGVLESNMIILKGFDTLLIDNTENE